MSLAQALEAGAKTLVIGVANRGGIISQEWKKVLVTALEEGFDLASGLHNLLREEADLVAVAEATGRALHDVRIPEVKYPIANGVKRTGKRLLAVGTDCSVGKMYTALCIDKEMQERGMKSTFRATGQTGILITGGGVPLDAVIADFMAGSIEWLTPDNDADHWDIIEGQGSLLHPAYAGVSLGLLHGAQADVIIVCHEAGRTQMDEMEGFSVPDLQTTIDINLTMGRVTNPDIRLGGIALNTVNLSEEEALAEIARIEKQFGVPVVDPVRTGVSKIVDGLTEVCYA